MDYYCHEYKTNEIAVVTAPYEYNYNALTHDKEVICVIHCDDGVCVIYRCPPLEKK
jgi:hypothetical protein